MDFKKATLFGMIGAIIPACINIIYLMINSGVIEWAESISICTNLLLIFSNCALFIFFYTLYNKQK